MCVCVVSVDCLNSIDIVDVFFYYALFIVFDIDLSISIRNFVVLYYTQTDRSISDKNGIPFCQT